MVGNSISEECLKPATGYGFYPHGVCMGCLRGENCFSAQAAMISFVALIFLNLLPFIGTIWA